MGIPRYLLVTIRSIISDRVTLSILGFLTDSCMSPAIKPYLASVMAASASSPKMLSKCPRIFMASDKTLCPFPDSFIFSTTSSSSSSNLRAIQLEGASIPDMSSFTIFSSCPICSSISEPYSNLFITLLGDFEAFTIVCSSSSRPVSSIASNLTTGIPKSFDNLSAFIL
ncbi:MAG: hypothetical protein A4E26_01362 [Methanobacterium sp. PtaU1.Bin097]|nr:MAG: hypothetical protein A4E26_01362 [Methanobacterium sp. PtaU1.Bin097]